MQKLNSIEHISTQKMEQSDYLPYHACLAIPPTPCAVCADGDGWGLSHATQFFRMPPTVLRLWGGWAGLDWTGLPALNRHIYGVSLCPPPPPPSIPRATARSETSTWLATCDCYSSLFSFFTSSDCAAAAATVGTLADRCKHGALEWMALRLQRVSRWALFLPSMRG